MTTNHEREVQSKAVLATASELYRSRHQFDASNEAITEVVEWLQFRALYIVTGEVDHFPGIGVRKDVT